MGLSVYEDYGEIDATFLRDHCWSGAKDRVKDLSDSDIETILDILADEYPDGMELTTLNDFFWFDDDTYAEWLGFKDADALWRGDNVNRDELYVDELDEDEDGNITYGIFDEEGTYADGYEFTSEEEAQAYLDEHRDEFTSDMF